MSIRLIIPPLHDLATVVAGQQPPDGDPAPARVRLTPRGLTGAVLVAGQPRVVAAEAHVIPAEGLVVTLADPSAATPSGWQWHVLIDPERGQRAVGVIDPEVTPGSTDGDDRVYQLAEVLAVSEAEAGVPVLVVEGPAGPPVATTWDGTRLVVGDLAPVDLQGPPPAVAWEGDRLRVGDQLGPSLTGPASGWDTGWRNLAWSGQPVSGFVHVRFTSAASFMRWQAQTPNPRTDAWQLLDIQRSLTDPAMREVVKTMGGVIVDPSGYSSVLGKNRSWMIRQDHLVVAMQQMQVDPGVTYAGFGVGPPLSAQPTSLPGTPL